VSRKWSNCYQNEVDEEIKGVGSRDEVKHNGRSDQLFLERMMSAVYVTCTDDPALVTADEK